MLAWADRLSRRENRRHRPMARQLGTAIGVAIEAAVVDPLIRLARVEMVRRRR